MQILLYVIVFAFNLLLMHATAETNCLSRVKQQHDTFAPRPSGYGVVQVHELHICPMSTTEVALTCHMVIPAGQPGDAYPMDVARHLKEDFGFHHATLQVETDIDSACALAPDHVV